MPTPIPVAVALPVVDVWHKLVLVTVGAWPLTAVDCVAPTLLPVAVLPGRMALAVTALELVAVAVEAAQAPMEILPANKAEIIIGNFFITLPFALVIEHCLG